MEIVNTQDALKNYSTAKTALERTTGILQDLNDDRTQKIKRSKDLKAQNISLALKSYYFKATFKYRELISGFHIWKEGMLLLVPPTLGFVVFIFFDMLLGVRSVSVVLSVLAIVFSFLVLLVLSKYPSESELERKISQTTSDISQNSDRLSDLKGLIGELDQKIAQGSDRFSKLQERVKELERITSTKYQCQKLFDENWRAMRNVEFELYLERVFKLLGYNTQTTNTTGDQGVDLIVEKAEHRIAIQVKGYLNSVSNSAIQEAFAGMRHYNCHACAVITNSKFTQSAMDLAASTNCFLIHEDNFREFVFGELAIG